MTDNVVAVYAIVLGVVTGVAWWRGQAAVVIGLLRPDLLG